MLCRFLIPNTNYPAFKANITDADINNLKSAKQYFSDCYLICSLETLTQTENGREILKKQIQYDDDNGNINCYLYNGQGNREQYSIPASTAVKGYEKLYKIQKNPIVRSVDISVAEYEKKHKSKYWLCSLSDIFKTYKFENNLPSHFMKMLTGVTPHIIGETDFNLDLSRYKAEVMKLFEKMAKEKEHSFIIATGVKKLDDKIFHVYVIENVNLEENTITVKQKRSNISQKMSIDMALKKFKYIVGYFNSDLKSAVKKV